MVILFFTIEVFFQSLYNSREPWAQGIEIGPSNSSLVFQLWDEIPAKD
jgi:hypothetical protein